MDPLGNFVQFLSGFPQVARATLDLAVPTEQRHIPAVGLSALTAEGAIDWSALDQAHPPQQLKVDHRLAAGDVVISARGSGAKIGLVRCLPQEPVYSTTNVIVVRPNQALVDPAYLWACLTKHRTDPREAFFSRSTTSQWSITLRELARLPLHLPPLEEQRRIGATVLSLQAAADAARAVANQYDHTVNLLINQFISAQTRP